MRGDSPFYLPLSLAGEIMITASEMFTEILWMILLNFRSLS
jgi:hypothetical protein